jgi:hypothetical protein
VLLLQKHFDDAQYESHRSDGVRKLRPDAVPMLFAVPDIASVPVPVLGQNTTARKRHAPVDHRKRFCPFVVHMELFTLNQINTRLTKIRSFTISLKLANLCIPMIIMKPIMFEQARYMK